MVTLLKAVIKIYKQKYPKGSNVVVYNKNLALEFKVIVFMKPITTYNGEIFLQYKCTFLWFDQKQAIHKSRVPNNNLNIQFTQMLSM